VDPRADPEVVLEPSSSSPQSVTIQTLLSRLK